MALSSVTLKAAIIAKVDAKIDPTHLVGAELDKFAEAVAEAVVEHVTTAAVVTVNTLTAGVTAGGATVPGTGVGTVT